MDHSHYVDDFGLSPEQKAIAELIRAAAPVVTFSPVEGEMVRDRLSDFDYSVIKPSASYDMSVTNGKPYFGVRGSEVKSTVEQIIANDELSGNLQINERSGDVE
jgi:hypothetical protein